MKAVFLRPLGEAPTWDPSGGRHDHADALIAGARASGDIADQKKLYMDFAVHLHRNRFPENGGEDNDHSDDAEWLRRLALYFGWSEELYKRIDAEAIREAYEVPAWAVEDSASDEPS